MKLLEKSVKIWGDKMKRDGIKIDNMRMGIKVCPANVRNVIERPAKSADISAVKEKMKNIGERLAKKWRKHILVKVLQNIWKVD